MHAKRLEQQISVADIDRQEHSGGCCLRRDVLVPRGAFGLVARYTDWPREAGIAARAAAALRQQDWKQNLRLVRLDLCTWHWLHRRANANDSRGHCTCQSFR